MKQIRLLALPLLTALMASLTSCQDFDEINVNPYAANSEQVQMTYFINNAIISAQQNPHIAERVFVLYWKDAGHMDRMGTLSEQYADDGWTTDYYKEIAGWLTHINTAIQMYDQKKELGKLQPEDNNLYQVARIWRVYLMSEFTDFFGPAPINGFEGKEVNFNTVEEVYTYMLKELKEAVNSMDGTTVSSDAAKLDPAYGYDFQKWVKYANSMRMRLAMRLSEVAPSIAQSEFEDAVKSGKYISEYKDMFAVQEKPGWDALTGVMSREWNSQYISTTINNLYTGLGGITSEEQIGAYARIAVAELNAEREKRNADEKLTGWNRLLPHKLKFNDPDWLGVSYPDQFTTMTNDPSAGYWNDGLNHIMDPRAYKAFNIPGDIKNPQFCKYPSWASKNVTTTQRVLLKPETGDTVTMINSGFCWNAPTSGNWGDKGAINRVYSFPGNTPRLVLHFRNSSAKRVFFGAWETYFLIAEAAVRGWNTPMNGKVAYERGITESFTYWDTILPDRKISGYLPQYLASTSYSRTGTSVSWEHTAEPPTTVMMRYLDAKSNTIKTTKWSYATNNLYKNGAIRNDQLTKIITQKFLAQVPWLPLETWSDHRRIGLPFFENPAVEKPIEGFSALTASNYMESRWEFFPQRCRYPSSLKNNAPTVYQEAISKLNGPDEISTKMWWSGKR